MSDIRKKSKPAKQPLTYDLDEKKDCDPLQNDQKISKQALFLLGNPEDYTGSAFTPEKEPQKTSSKRDQKPKNEEYFKLVFWCTVGFTVLMFILGYSLIIIELYTSKDNNLKTYINNFFDLGKIGFGAIVGLLGGRVGK